MSQRISIQPRDIVVEPFVTDDETKILIQRIFIGVGLMIGASILSILFYWSYHASRSIFIVMLNVFMLAYAIEMVIMTHLIREKLDATMYYTYMGSAISVGFVAFFMIIVFTIKFFRDKSSSSYVPSNIQNYVSH